MRLDKQALLIFALLLILPWESGAQIPPSNNAALPPNTSTGATATPPASDVTNKFGTPETPTQAPGTSSQTISPDNQDADTGEDLIYLNATDVDIKDMIKQISKATGANFLIDDKVKGKVTIISEKPMTKEMAYQAFLSALQVMGFTTVTTPSGLIKIIQNKDALTEPIDIYKEENPDTDRYITRIIQVKNISANDLSTVIKPLVSKEGNLFAYPATNSLIITDTGSNIDRILKIAKELDQEGPQEKIEIIPIINADATDVTQKILDLFEGGQKSQQGSAAPRRTGGAELEDSPTISKVIADQRTNSVIVMASERGISKIKALIARLDSAVQGVEGQIHVYYLKYATAKDLADVLSNLVSGATTKAGAKKAAGSAGSSSADAAKAGGVQLEGSVKVTSDDSTNSLVISASPKDYETLVEQVVEKLDIPRRQVYLEAVVMELDVSKKKNLGINGQAGFQPKIGGESFTLFGALPPLVSASSLTSLATATGGLAGGILSSSTIPVVGANGQTTQIPIISSLITALETDNDVNILSTPSVMTLDNQAAMIKVGNKIPIESSTQTATGFNTVTPTYQDVDIELDITPQISESDTVRLDIDQKVDDLGAYDADGNPTISNREVKTFIVAKDKQTVVIGGLIKDNTTVTTNKVPYLGDIPVLGNLFKQKSTDKEKTNIIVFITPYIIRDRADYMSILQRKLEERNLFIDLNYGVTQRKLIRESLKNHTNTLLSYKGGPQDSAEATAAATTPSTVTQEQALPSQVTPSDNGDFSNKVNTITSTTMPQSKEAKQSTHTIQQSPPSQQVVNPAPSNPPPSNGTSNQQNSDNSGSTNYGPPSSRVK